MKEIKEEKTDSDKAYSLTVQIYQNTIQVYKKTIKRYKAIIKDLRKRLDDEGEEWKNV
jgi:flagellar biosynthesis chaperone FliJ